MFVQSENTQLFPLVQSSYAALFPDQRYLYTEESEIRQIQLIQLRMLKILDAVCRDYQLTYWLDAGTLLGAIRHKGFIPWDDDVDVVMPRPDYDRFIELASSIFCEDVFFQNNRYTDPGYNFFWTKLRDRRSTAMDDFECAHPLKYHMGIGLDIFCFDGCDDLKTYYRRKRFMNYEYRSKHKRACMRMLRNLYTFVHPKSKWISRLGSEYAQKYETSSYLIKSFDCIFKGHFRKEVVFPLTRVEFEGVLLPVPGNWDEYLKITYGDYMKLPPLEEQQIRRHFKTVDFFHACEWDKKNLINTPQDYRSGNFFVGEPSYLKAFVEDKNHLHLVYVYFGTREDHIRQIRLSVSSWMERSNVPLCIHLVTDQSVLMHSWLEEQKEHHPEVFRELYMHSISSQTLIEWQGKHHFPWRIKMKALEYVQREFPGIALLYLDGDTYLRHSASSLLRELKNGISLMHLNEGELCHKKSKTERLMWRGMKGKHWNVPGSVQVPDQMDETFEVNESSCMWNAGVIGLPAEFAQSIISQSITLCDAWLDAGIRPRLLEQFAFSVVLSSRGTLRASDDKIGHYWFNKEAFNL